MTFPGIQIGQLGLDSRLRVVESDTVLRALFGGADPTGSTLDDLVSERDRRGGAALAAGINSYVFGSVLDLQLVLVVGDNSRYVRMRLVGNAQGYRAYIEPADDPTSLTYELSQLRQRWTTIFNRSEDGIAILDESGCVVEINQQFLELIQLRSNHGILLASEALTGRVLADQLPSDLEALSAALRGRQSDFALSIQLGLHLLDIKGRAMRDPASGRTETFLLVRDVTEQRQIEARDNLIRADLHRAAMFQRSVFQQLPPVPGMQLGLLWDPLDAVGGDVYDAVLLAPDRLRLFIADATGHGIEAALATMLIKNEYDAIKARIGSPAECMYALNDRIARNHRKVEVMFSAAIVDLDPTSDRISYTNAGHPAPIMVVGGDVRELDEDGALVGVRPGQAFPELVAEVPGWISCVLVTDGIADTRSPAGQELGTARLHAAISDANQRARDIGTEVRAQLQAFRGLARARDDSTLLSATRVTSPIRP